MDDPPSSERVAAIRRDDGRDPLRDGVGVDGEWDRHRVCEGEH